MAQLVKNPPAVQETLVQFLGWNETHHQISMSGDLGQDAGPPEAPVYSAEARGAWDVRPGAVPDGTPLPGPGPAEPLTSQRIWRADLERQRARHRQRQCRWKSLIRGPVSFKKETVAKSVRTRITRLRDRRLRKLSHGDLAGPPPRVPGAHGPDH